MTYNQKQRLKSKLPPRSISKIAKIVNKSRQHVRNCFEISNYNDEKVFELAYLLIIEEQKFQRKLKKVTG